ncbi:hypothetical protein BOC57_35040 [Burkholderia pseudomallei]|nr:hypothetical protein BOC57_35040 [Burkholderia pseudomallei]
MDKKSPDYLNWLRSIGPGQKIAIERHHFGRDRQYDVLEVSRITPSMIVCNINEHYDRRFDRKTGKEKGVEHRWYEIQPVTNGIIASLELRNLRAWIGGIKPDSLGLDALRAIKAIVDKEQA